jgi:PAS domain S-box-containing protein
VISHKPTYEELEDHLRLLERQREQWMSGGQENPGRFNCQKETRLECESFMRRILDSLFAFVGVLTPEGTLIEANRAALDAAGLKPENVLGKPFEQTYWWSWSPEVQVQLQDAIQSGARGDSSRFDVIIRLGPGRFIPIDFMMSPMRDRQGRISHLIPSAVPIEEQKRMEEALQDASNNLEDRVSERTAELSRTIQAMRAEVARRMLAEQALHERSEQLRALASALTLAEQRERQRMAQILHNNLQQLLVGAKFRITRLERHQDAQVRQQAIELQDLISHSLETSRTLTGELCPPILREGGLIPALEWLARWMEERHGLRVEMELHEGAAPEMEDVTILLFQAVRELFFNVVKHAMTNIVRLRLACIQDRIEILVADSGAGFDPKTLQPSSGVQEGYGLFSIRERFGFLGGRMEIDSAPGQGCRIKLVAPLSHTRSRCAEWEEGSSGPEDSKQSSDSSLRDSDELRRKIRVLLVDDHAVMRQGLARLLKEEEDIEIIGEASDGESGLSMTRRLAPDVVLMDISMPGMNGIQATQLIHAEMPRVHVIGLSMYEEGERAEDMRQAGASDYLAKSGPTNAVVTAIRTCISRTSQPAGDARPN